MGSKKTTTSTATATTTPNVPDYALGPVQNYYGQVGNLSSDPYAYATPANSNQQSAFAQAGDLSNNGALYGQATNAAQGLLSAQTPTAGYQTAQLGTLNAPQQAQVAQAQAANAGTAAQAQAAQAQAANAGSALMGTAANAGSAAQVSAANAGTAANVNLGGYQVAPLASAQGYTAAQAGPVNLSGNAAQAQSQSLLTNLNSYLNPTTQALVDSTLANYDDQAGRQQAAMTAQAAKNKAFGGSRYGIAEAQFGADTARNRALTEAQLRNQAWTTATGLSQYDTTNRQNTGMFNAGAQNQRAETLAGLQAQNAQFNAGQTNAAGQFNAGSQNDFSLAQFGAQNAANQFGAAANNQGQMFNADASNQFALTNSGYQQQANLANQDATNQFALTNSGYQQQTGLANQAAGNQFALANAGFQQDANLANAGFQQQTGLANQAATNQYGLANAGFQQDANLANAGYQQDANLANAAAGNQFSLAQYGAANDLNQFNAGAYNQNQQFNANQQQQQQGQQLAAAGLLADTAGNMSANDRANLSSLLDAGNAQYGVDSAYNQSPLSYLAAQSGLLNPALISAISGQTVNSNGTDVTKSSGGLLGALASIAKITGTVAPMMSDRRLKTNIAKVGELPDGLGLYSWDYIWGEPATGVMADEVAALRPWALGPEINGFATVNMGAL